VRTHHASFQTWLHSKYFHISTKGGIFTDEKKHMNVIFIYGTQKIESGSGPFCQQSKTIADKNQKRITAGTQ
jgi:hypothetical protein